MEIQDQDIERMNDLADGCIADSSFQFAIGMEIGLMDPITMSKDSVIWHTLQYIEPDDELPIAMLYFLPTNLESTKGEDLHTKTVMMNGQPYTFQYTEIEDSINSRDRMVLPQ